MEKEEVSKVAAKNLASHALLALPTSSIADKQYWLVAICQPRTEEYSTVDRDSARLQPPCVPPHACGENNSTISDLYR